MNQSRPTREQLIELAKTDPEAIADIVLKLWDRVEALEAKVAELERNSRNSSKPPSTDKGNFTHPPKPKSLRGISNRKPGGQKGHRSERLTEIFSELFSCPLSAGTLANFVKRGGKKAAQAMGPVRGALVRSEVAHADETGCRVHGKSHWLHVFSTATLTCFQIDVKRGKEAMIHIGLLFEQGSRSDRTLKSAIATMYVEGVSTRRVTKIMEKLCGFQVSSTQVSKLTAELDSEFQNGVSAPLPEITYLTLDATRKGVNRHGKWSIDMFRQSGGPDKATR